MYKIKIISRFSAAHSLRNYNGKCEALHGHNWRVEVVISSSRLNASGMVMDFAELKAATAKVLEALDHRHINELDYFSASGGESHNPSSEEIARYVFDKLKGVITEKGCKPEEVRVWETDNSCAIYQE